MPKHEHLVSCGGVPAPGEARAHINLNLHGRSPNVHLKIADISKRLLVNIPDALVDLLEIASYVYAADSVISRGAPVDAQMGIRWRRRFRFIIPVRVPKLWSSAPVVDALVETLTFLSEDEYHFDFRSFRRTPSAETYFELPANEVSRFTPNEVILLGRVRFISRNR